MSFGLKNQTRGEYAALVQHTDEEYDQQNMPEVITGSEFELSSNLGQSNLIDDDSLLRLNSGVYMIGRNKRCCNSNSVLKASLFVSISLLVLTLVVTVPRIIGKDESQTLCISESCVNAVSSFLNSLDTSVNPCEDFYEFSCGNWKRNNPLPSGHSKWDNFNLLWSSNQAKIKAILESVNTTDENTAEWKSKVFYQSCVNLVEINKLNGTPAQNLIEEVGGWSLDESWDPKNFDLSKLISKTLKYGVMPLAGIYIGKDLKNSTLNLFQIDEGSLGLGTRSYYLNKTKDHVKLYNAYLDYMTDISLLLGANKSIAEGKLKEVLKFETKLANISMPIEEQRDPLKNYNRFTLSELSKICPELEWFKIFKSYAAFSDDLEVTLEEPVIVNSLNYLKRLSGILKNTSTEVIQNFFVWHLSSLFLHTLGQPFMDIRYRYHKFKTGSDASCIERWRTCVSEVNQNFGDVMGRSFVKQYFDSNSNIQANKMVKKIKESLKSTLVAAEWMDSKTTTNAIKKLNKIEDKIGFPQYILNVSKTNEDFKQFIIKPSNSYFENYQALAKFSVIYELNKLRKPVDKKRWSVTPSTVNAYYSSTSNNIVFPAGILQPPFFAANLPPSVTFGSVGFIVGHELTHGFDDNGRQFDYKGNLHDWWETSTENEFNKKTKCIENQYNGYSMHGINLNGNLTLGETIADGGGLNIAYQAYMQWKKGNENINEESMPALPYTHDQLFFMSFARIWCQVSTEEADKDLIQTNEHPPSKYRVIGTVSNSPEFAKAFSCPTNSPMNPPEKCKIW